MSDSATQTDPMMAAGMPGPEHEKLGQFLGTFAAHVKMWMGPDGDPMESHGTMVNTWALGKRFIRHDYHSEFEGHVFEGAGYFGFNNVTRKYEGLWVDTMSTGFMLEYGECDASGKVWTMEGTADFPTAGNTMHKRTVVTVKDDDHHSMESWVKGPDGSEFKTMEIQYTRQT